MESDKTFDPYDQYTDFNKLPTLLKRFSFAEKMLACNNLSRRTLKYESSSNYHEIANECLPVVIETFALLSIEAQEYNNCKLDNKKINKMIQAIWNSSHLALQSNGSHAFDAGVYTMSAIGLTQFYMQENFWIKLYRYWRFFTDTTSQVCLADKFKQHFGTEYSDFLIFGLYIRLMYLVKNPIAPNIAQPILQYLTNEKFPYASTRLCLPRDKCIERIKYFAGNTEKAEKYLYSLRPLATFPFILYQERFWLPLPHLITTSITSGLLYQLTQNNNTLRSEIGKYVLEPYLLSIVKESNIYDEIYGEQKYTGKHGTEAKSSDVLVRKGTEVLFLESKSTVPNLGIRIQNDDAIKKSIETIGHHITQLYKQMQHFDQYNPFGMLASSDPENHWGIIVILEDSYILRDLYYEYSFSELNVEATSSIANWIKGHICVASLYEIEVFCYYPQNLIDAMKHRYQEKKYNFYFISQYWDTAIGSHATEGFADFKNKTTASLDALTQELVQKGFFNHT